MAGGTVTCDASSPNPERNGAFGSQITLLPGSIVQVDDPFAGASPQNSTILVFSNGSLTTSPDSQILNDYGSAVASGSNVSMSVSGLVSGRGSNGVLVGASSSIVVNQGGIVETTANNSRASAAIGVTGGLAQVSVDGSVRTTGGNAPAIATGSTDLFGTSYYNSRIVVGQTGLVSTSGPSSPTIVLAGGSSLQVAGQITATGSGSSAISYVAGPGQLAEINVLAGGLVRSTQAAAISGTGTAANVTIAGSVDGPNGGAAIALGENNDSLTLLPSANISGTIDGGLGTDTIVLAGSGPGLLRGTTNFETLSVQSGAWTLSGAQSFSNGATLTSGTLTIGAGATLTSGASVTVSSTATPLSIVNAGAIANTNPTGRAINIAGPANSRTITITNAARATITSSDDAVRINTNLSGGSVLLDNAGTIQTTNGGQAVDFDAIASGGTTVTIINRASGVLRSFGQDAIRPGQGASVTNAGLIYADGLANSNFDGIDWQGKSGTVVNEATGTISGLRHGITSDVNVDVINAGIIIGRNGSGVGSDGNGRVVNSGTITGQWDGVATNGDGDGVDIDFIGAVVNSGIIQGLSARGVDSGGQPNAAEGIAIGGGTITNNAGGTIFGAGNAILVDNGSGGAAYGSTTITNAGTIRAGSGAAIRLVGTFADSVINSGTINAGASGVAIDLGAGDDRLTLSTGGTVNGLIDGGAGTDALALTGTGAGSLGATANFETLAVQSGAWTLTAPSTYSGGTTIAVGATLIASAAELAGAVADNGTLRLNQATDASSAAVITGAGTISKTGPGALTLASLTGFTGSLNVATGRLASVSSVTVGAGQTLSGNGTLSAPTVTVVTGARAAPGASIGTLTIQGNFVQQAGSLYAAEIDSATSDRIVVTGSANLQPGAELTLTGTPGPVGTRYTLLTAAGGVTGTYAFSQASSSLTDIQIGYSADAVTAAVVRNRLGLSATARTNNQQSLAAAIGVVGSGNAAYAALVAQPADSATRAGLDSLTGEIHPAMRTAMVRDASLVRNTALDHAGDSGEGIGLWAAGLADWGHDDGTPNGRGAAKTRRDTRGGLIGLGYAMSDIHVGVAGGYSRTKLMIDDRASSGRLKTIHLLGYAAGQFSGIRFRGSAGYGWMNGRTDRRLAFGAFSDRLRADADGGVLQGSVEAALPLALAGGEIAPFVGLEGYRAKSDAFAESGGAAALRAGKRTQSSGFSRAGLQARTPLTGALSAEGSLGWHHRFAGGDPTTLASFGGVGGFRVAGAPLSRDAAEAALGVSWAPAERFRLSTNYGGLIGNKGDDSAVQVAATLLF